MLEHDSPSQAAFKIPKVEAIACDVNIAKTHKINIKNKHLGAFIYFNT
jgi:hypothetical protein